MTTSISHNCYKGRLHNVIWQTQGGEKIRCQCQLSDNHLTNIILMVSRQLTRLRREFLKAISWEGNENILDPVVIEDFQDAIDQRERTLNLMNKFARKRNIL